ncbi:hypothetical protein LCGC14_0645860 [marine sediment metagenome]|uniref:Uncharacterized protein n=1 Tax=marine sediment metagenome TaxID=412755 RepID=A0A0F9U647_9ZZZZ
MQKKLILVSAALFAVVLLTAATPQSAAGPKPVAAMTAPAGAAAPTAMQPVMAAPAAMSADPAKAAAPTVTAAPKKDSTGSVIGGSLLQILLVVLTIAIPIVLTPVVKWLLKKMKVEDLQTIQMVDGIVDQAVVVGLNYANEQAHKLGDNPIKGAEKLAVARDKAIAYLKDSGIVDKGAGYIEDLIEAKLGEDRESDALLAAMVAEPEDGEKPADDPEA